MSCHVVHMTSVHQPFDTRIFHKECKSLAKAGYSVTLIAARGEGDLVEDGVHLRAIKPPLNRRERLTQTIPAVYQAALDEDARIYHFHDPELMPVGMLLKLRGKKVIYDVHEDYGANMRKQWIPSALQGAASLAVNVAEVTMGRACDRIVAATRKLAEKFSSPRTALIQNYPLLEELRVAEGLPHARREPVIAYVGWLAQSRGMREMTAAIQFVAKEMPATLVIGGEAKAGADREFDDGSATGLIEHLGFVDRLQVAALLARARVGIVVYHPTPNYLDGQPTKLLEYMSAGLPVVASNFPFYRQVVEPARCGILVDPLKPAEIAEALLWMLRHPAEAEEMGRRGQKAVTELYSWEREAQRLLATYAELEAAV